MKEVNQRDFSAVSVVWEPKEDSGKNMKAFMKKIQTKYNVKIDSYWDIYRWSIENIDKFWEEIWHDSGIIFSKPFHKVIDLTVPMHEFQDWFSGARMNFAENLLKYRDDHVALIVAGEDSMTEKITYAKLYQEVKLYAAAFRKNGVKKGDKVSCFMSNRKEAVFAMIAAASLGAIWLGALPLMGSQAVLNRFKQVEPKLLFTVDRFPHGREEKDMLPKLKDIAEGLPSLEKVIIVASTPASKSKEIRNIRNSCFLDEFLDTGKELNDSMPEIVFEQVAFTHPVFINYTSGTTGLPKALVHSSCGLLSIYRDYMLHSNSDRNNCWLSMSPVGWATWNFMTTQLFLGLTVVLFEGLPFFLSPTFLWDMVDEFKITNLLLTPNALDELERREFLPTDRNHLRSLKVIISGGSVVKPQNFDFFYNKVKKDVIFTSAYGSTEMSGSCALVSDETVKIHCSEIPVPALAIDVQVIGESGKPAYGELGELVICKTVPNLPEIWQDPDRSILKKTYYENFPGRFAVDDLAIINPITRGTIIYGRSDETLNAKGCRFGSSEIYNIVNTFPEVGDSLCVAQYNQKREERAVLFLKMKPGNQYNQDLVQRIRDAIAKELSIRHVPEVILETKDIPYNLNGKKMEIIVKKIINKMPYNPETVINPESLEKFKDVPELGEF